MNADSANILNRDQAIHQYPSRLCIYFLNKQNAQPTNGDITLSNAFPIPAGMEVYSLGFTLNGIVEIHMIIFVRLPPMNL